MSLDEVIVVHKTHLDIGFTALPSQVVDQYCESFIPQALALAKRLATDDEIGFIWTTGSWLVHIALERADKAQRQVIEEAIEQGWLRWHALPFTTHTEIADPLLLRAGLAISQQLDSRFGCSTAAAKMTDVPGHSIGLVPLLAEAGVGLLHIGVNPASHLPTIPPAFRWRHPRSGSDITVLYEQGYGRVHRIPGSRTGLAFLHTQDNLGPPSIDAIRAEFTALRAEYPGAQIRSGTLEDAVACLDPSDLPIIETEIGDSWLHGVASAPQRLGDLMAIRRTLSAAPASPERTAAAQSALMVAEHTWGLDCKKYLPNNKPLDPMVFANERRHVGWRVMEQAYAEQDAYIDETVAAAGPSLGPQLGDALAESRGRRGLPQPGPTAEPLPRSQPLTTPRWVLRFDEANGTVNQLVDRHRGVDCCAGVPGGRLGMLRYHILGAERYRNWVEQYLLPDEELWWAVSDFDGPQQHDVFPRDLIVPTRANAYWIEHTTDASVVTVHHGFRHPRMGETGVPSELGVQWSLPHDPDAPITIDIGWDTKPACLARESLWFGWRMGSKHQPERITMEKLGTTIEVGDVVDHGGLLHAADAVTLHHTQLSTCIRPLDAPVMCPDGPRILEVREGDIDRQRGVWWNLLNTAWSTNFGMWTEGAMGYRFMVNLANPS